MEELLSGIWAEVLGHPRVGIEDNFFALGGDSISSIQVVARSNQAGIGITAKQMFEHQTIAELAAQTPSAHHHTAEQGIVFGPVPLTPIQRRFFELVTVDHHHFNQSVFLTLTKPVLPDIIRAAIEQIVSHHDVLRSRFTRHDDGWSQIVNPSEDTEALFEAIDLDVYKRQAVFKARRVRLALRHRSESISSGSKNRT